MTDYGQDTADKCAAIDLRIDPIPGEKGAEGEEEHLASFRSEKVLPLHEPSNPVCPLWSDEFRTVD